MVGFGVIERWSILVLAAIYGSVMSFVFPTRTTMVPSLVARADLSNALALNAAGQNATRVIGPSLAGILIAVFGVTGTFVAGALMQVLALYSTWHLPKRVENPQSRGTAQPGNLTLGFRIVARDPFMLSVILMALATNVLVMPYLNLMPVFARDELEVGSTGLGVLMASAGLGTVAGALLVARSAWLNTWPKSQLATSVAFCVLVMLFAVTPVVGAAVLLLFLAGLVSAAFLALNQTSLQMRVDDNVRGRVFSIYLMTWGVLPIGQLSVGALADLMGSPLAVVVACAISLVAIGYITRRYRSPHDKPSTA
jgi:predicted MFS family arabinose efflux permease